MLYWNLMFHAKKCPLRVQNGLIMLANAVHLKLHADNASWLTQVHSQECAQTFHASHNLLHSSTCQTFHGSFSWLALRCLYDATCTNVCASPRLDLHKPMCVMHKWLKNRIPLFGMQRALRKSSALEWAHVIHLHFCHCHHSTQDNHTASGKLLPKDV